LLIAEEGNLRDVVGMQSKLASEKAIRESVEAIATEYTNGWTLANIQRSFDQILMTAGTCTDDQESKGAFEAIKIAVLANNAAIKQKELEINAMLKTCAAELTQIVTTLKISHQRMSGEVAIKLADLKSRGLTADIPGLELLLRLKTSAAREIAGVEQKTDERKQCQEQRAKLRAELSDIRASMTARRKEQLKTINANLG
jgi:hypothetical protein